MKVFSSVLGMLGIVTALPAAADSFIEGMDDIPIAPAFTQIQSDTISFGGISSHFLEATLVAKEGTPLDSYKEYYIENLPQFGWELVETKDLKLIFYRGEETLEITREYAKPLTIRINIFGGN